MLRQYDLPADELQQALDTAFDQGKGEWLPPEEQAFPNNKVVDDHVRKVTAEEVWGDVGYKNEGAIELRECYDEGLG